ncbi:SDR family NAD(P)-dependent oxidoreductase [Cytobacillus sp. S13-E01]|uniref:SDR family NAD(P)-dependent oxidoreductase n=1 Tax=Cytobacillus sp. S13-E01 TaxID=3031326 RepID=UPI0023D88AE4|nr:SDR family oxidoreductase [Cytobacillus sp. S13-E01]MDF0725961.1 SDR family NAD(P)-dependent oxidoreductase [Cytobacillus sp. S13-E01]
MRTAIVTGGGSGIGKAVAIELANEQYRVVVADIHEENAGCVANDINHSGGEALALYVDLTDEHSIIQVVENTIKWTGSLDVLVNNAGVNFRYSVENCPSDEFDSCIAINLKGHYLFSKYAIPFLKKAREASIVNIASTHAFRTQPQFFPYHSAKGGMISMTKGMAIDLSQDGIRVNVVCPGFIKTAIMDPSFYEEESSFMKKVLPYHPSGRIGQPEDVAYAVSFLASEKASFINGEVLTVDGGRNALTYTLD